MALNDEKNDVVLLQETITKIKQLIIQRAENKKILEAINAFCNRYKDAYTRRVFKRSLIQSTNKLKFQYNYNMNIAQDEFIHKIYNQFIKGGVINESTKTITLDINRIYGEYKDGTIPKEEAVDKFRNTLTNAKKGLPLIKNYDKLVMAQVELLAKDNPTYENMSQGGKALTRLSLRNKVEMSIRYAQSMQDIADQRESGQKLVFISTHADCSPRCMPFQGLLYSLDGTTGEIDGIKYKPIEEALQGTNGDGNGCLSGYNCRHHTIPYEKGMPRPQEYSHEEIQKEYAIDQKQRVLENKIRELRTKEILLREQGYDKKADKAKEKHEDLYKAYDQFSRENGRAVMRWRCQV